MILIPDALTSYHLNSAGFEASDPRIVRLISVAAQKIISDIANNALIHCKTRTSNANSSHASSKQQKDKSAIDHSSTVDCTLSLESTGQECLDNMCQRIGIQQPEFFGLKYLFKGSFSAHIHDGCQFIECPFGLCKWKSSRQQLGCEFSQFKCFPR
uniref:CSON011620 protein n=1 Tax=Culicoides sonorensis TaxID=179676 RepID=A0A336N035_CULSO